MKKYISLSLLFLSLKVIAKEMRIVVLDSGRDPAYKFNECGKESRDFTGTDLNDPKVKHGTNIAWLIEQELKPYRVPHCFIFLKFISMDDSGEKRIKAYIDALNYLTTLDYDAVNMSIGGIGALRGEKNLFIGLSKKRGIIVVASGNDRLNLDKSCRYYPACFRYKNIIVVGNTHKSSNYGKDAVTLVIPAIQVGPPDNKMTGSSQSAAIFTGKLMRFLYERQETSK